MDALKCDGQALEGLLQRHIAVGFLLKTVTRLHYWVEQASDNRLLVHSLNQVYTKGHTYAQM